MAKILSQIMVAGSGSIGGITIFTPRGPGIGLRARALPVNPMDMNQAYIRGAFSDASVSWRALSDEDRQAWLDYASGLVRSGLMGDYTPTGREVFMGNYTISRWLENMKVTITPATDPPLLPGDLGVTNFNLSAPTAVGIGLSIQYYNPNPEDCIMYAELSRPFDASRRRFKGPFLPHTLVDDVAVSETSSAVDVLGLQLGAVYFVRFRLISENAPFRISSEHILRGIAEETVI